MGAGQFLCRTLTGTDNGMAAVAAARAFVMAEKAKDATRQVLDMRQRLDKFKTRLTEARTKKTGAEDQLTAADDAVEELGLDPDRDLERQEAALIVGIADDLDKLEGYLTEAELVLGGDRRDSNA